MAGSHQGEQSGFAKYHLLAELGRGGMADVYLARFSGPGGFNKLVVVKRLRDSSDSTLVSMFLDEAKLAARMTHPNVVHTFEVGHEEDNVYLVMEFLDGPALSRIRRACVAKGAPTPLAVELFILQEALAGLHHAHELRGYDGHPLGVVHRDFTPQNVLVSYGGEVKIADFGIAKALDQQLLTSAGVFKGKLTYVPPEQLRGEAVDQRADVFAAGVMLFEAITGQSPWHGMNNAQVTHALSSGRIPQLMERSNAPPELAAICDQAMAVDPDNRYPSALALREAIAEFVGDQGLTMSRGQLGEFVTGLLGDARERTRKIIEQQLKVPTTPTAPLSLPLLDRITPAPAEKVVGRSVPQLMTSGAMPSTGVKQEPREEVALAAWRRWAWLAAGVALTLLSIVGWRLSRPSTGPPPPAVSAVAAPTPATPKPATAKPTTAKPAPPAGPTDHVASPTTPSPASVAVNIRVSPATAKVFLDGAELRNPYQGEMPAGGEHRLVARAAGHQDSVQTLRFDQTVDVDTTLVPVAPAVRPPPAPTRIAAKSKRPPDAPAAPLVAPADPAPVRKTEARPSAEDDADYLPSSAPKKIKRSIDPVEF